MDDLTPDIAAWMSLTRQPIQNLSAEQLSIVAAGWAGMMVRAKMEGSDDVFLGATRCLSTTLKEFRRRCADLDPLIPRSEY